MLFAFAQKLDPWQFQWKIQKNVGYNRKISIKNAIIIRIFYDLGVPEGITVMKLSGLMT